MRGKRISIASFCFVLLAALVSYSVHKFNLFTAGIVVFGVVCSILGFIANATSMITCRTCRTTHSIFALVFGIISYLVLFGFSGRSMLWEIHQHRRDKWFLEVGKPKFELIVSNSTNHLGKVEQEVKSDIPDVNVIGKRNEDGTVDLQFVLIGGVPRQGYLYHSGEPIGKYPRHYISVKMITNQWYDVTY
jgi:hypothetical protein